MLQERASCRGNFEVEKGHFIINLLTIILLLGQTYFEHCKHRPGADRCVQCASDRGASGDPCKAVQQQTMSAAKGRSLGVFSQHPFGVLYASFSLFPEEQHSISTAGFFSVSTSVV